MSGRRVSVVIPAHNAAAHIRDALESVLAQTHAAHEIIVVDDGSADRTSAIAREYQHVTVINIPHGGVSIARNTGAALSSGDYIAFLDADDTWHPEKLELQANAAAEQPLAGVVVCRQEYRFDGPIPGWFRGPRDGSSEPGYMPSNWLLRRTTWDHVGGFVPAMTHSEDTDWLARARDMGVLVHMVDRVLVVHRIHNANASARPAEVREGVLRALRDSVARKRLSP
jgi:glycosyltransferase involved in cell wall biosynthesis